MTKALARYLRPALPAVTLQPRSLHFTGSALLRQGSGGHLAATAYDGPSATMNDIVALIDAAAPAPKPRGPYKKRAVV
jgi:hypothetical protein